MGPSTSTKSIPDFIINYVKYQHIQGVIPKREDIKLALKQQWELTPYVFGSSNDGMTTSDWESSVYPTFRSMYAKAKNNSGGQKGLEELTIVTIDGIDMVFHTPTWLKHSAGASLKEMTGTKLETIKDIHTTAQFTLCNIGRRANCKIYVPNSDRNLKSDNGLTVAKEFSDILVNDFIGYNNLTKEIDVIFLEERNDSYYPLKAFEVENSTAVVKGLTRLKSLGVDGTIVSTQKSYKKIFDDSMENAFAELKGKIKYAEFSKIVRFSDTITDFESSLTFNEIIQEIYKKI